MADLIWRIVDRSPGRAHFLVECDHGGVMQGGEHPECSRSLWTKPASGVMWQWDGNKTEPSITPSIDCKGGCGRHFTMTKGIAQ